MKLLIATPLFSFWGDAGHFWLRAFNRLGHYAIVWDYRLEPEPPKVEVDASIVFKGETIDPVILPRPSICYWPDAFERDPGIEEKLKKYDKVFTPVKPTPDGMIWLPTGWEPLIHRDLKLLRSIDTLYIGTANSEYKVNMIKAIAPQVVAGNEWGKYGVRALPPQYLHDFVHLVNQSKILIDIHQAPHIGINRKLFESITCGFTLVDKVPGVDEIFPGFYHDISFKSPDTARSKILYYLTHEKERDEVWELEKQAIQPYSYENCARQILF